MRLKSGIAALAVSLALMLPGCTILDDILTGPDDPPCHEHELSCETVVSAQLVPLAVIDVACDPYQLAGVALKGDVLCAETEFGGGCSDHVFNLLVDTDVMESDPPQVQAMLIHNANNDPCYALLTKKVGFDLTPLKEQMRRFTGRESGSVRLNISGKYSVLYRY